MTKMLINLVPCTTNDLRIPTVYEYKEYRTRIKDLNAHGNVIKDDSTHVQIFKKLESDRTFSLIDLAQTIKQFYPQHQNALLICFEIVGKKARFFFCNMNQPYVQENLVFFESDEIFYEKDLEKIVYLITLYLFTTKNILILPIQNKKNQERYKYFIENISKISDEKEASCSILSETECKKVFKNLKIIESNTNKFTRKALSAAFIVLPMLLVQISLNFFETKFIKEITPKISLEKTNEAKLKSDLMIQAGKIAEADSFLKQNLRVCP